jgi:uncharacterized protein (TIGR00369 family)
MDQPQITVEKFNELAKGDLPFTRDYGVEVVEIGFGTAHVRVPFRREFVRPGGTLNGPLLMAIADLAAYAAVLGVVGYQPLAVTSELSIHFLRKPAPAGLSAHATVIKRGRKLMVVEIHEFSDGDPEMVAHTMCTYALPSVTGRTSE